LGYITVSESLGMPWAAFMQCAPEATELGEERQNSGHCAVQGHSRSPILVPIEN